MQEGLGIGAVYASHNLVAGLILLAAWQSECARGRSTMDALRTDSCCEDKGWGGGSYFSPSHGLRTQLNFGDADVCAMSKLDGKCYGNADYFSAKALCDEQGARLCTAQELENDESHGSGCNYDYSWVWSSTPCVVGGCSGNTNAARTDVTDMERGYEVRLGFTGNGPGSGSLVQRCAGTLDTYGVNVRCCMESCSVRREKDVNVSSTTSRTAPTATSTAAVPPEPSTAPNPHACAPDRSSGRCTCANGDSKAACALLGAVVGTQFDSEGTCFDVDCSSKHLKALPDIPDYTTHLNLQANPEMVTWPAGSFDHLRNVRWLFVSSAYVTKIPPKLFAKMHKLHIIELSHMNMTELVADTFYGMEEVRQAHHESPCAPKGACAITTNKTVSLCMTPAGGRGGRVACCLTFFNEGRTSTCRVSPRPPVVAHENSS